MRTFIFAYNSIPLCSPVMPIVVLKLTYYSQIMLKDFLVHGQNISFSMRAHALNGVPRVIIMSSCEKGFEASLLFSLV